MLWVKHETDTRGQVFVNGRRQDFFNFMEPRAVLWLVSAWRWRISNESDSSVGCKWWVEKEATCKCQGRKADVLVANTGQMDVYASRDGRTNNVFIHGEERPVCTRNRRGKVTEKEGFSVKQNAVHERKKLINLC